MKKVITRFPPSPTGTLHVGSARTALFNYLFAKHYGGQMRLRMEDTDKERSKKEFEENIIEGLKWLGIDWKGDIWRQSERTDIYISYIKKLIDSGLAYEAEENKEKTGRVIRFKNPGGVVVFKDELRGDIKTDVSDLGDFVIARDINSPLYHLTVVVDDYEMGVTHIIRGEDGLANTPRQILLQEALGFPRPVYIHIPFILGKDKNKLSKRHGAKDVLSYKDEGFLKEALINFLALLGWRSKKDDEKEIWSLDELIAEFDESGFQKSPAVFNEEKLLWINKEWLKKKGLEEFENELKNFIPNELYALLEGLYNKEDFLLDLKDRISVYSEFVELYKKGEFDWLKKEISLDPQKLIWKKSDKESALRHLEKVKALLSTNSWSSAEDVEKIIMPYADKEGRGDVLWPLRYALSGAQFSPSPFVLISSLGPERSIDRINKAIELLKN